MSIYIGLTLDVDRYYIGIVTATTNQEKGIIKLESNASRGTVLPAPHGKREYEVPAVCTLYMYVDRDGNLVFGASDGKVIIFRI